MKWAESAIVAKWARHDDQIQLTLLTVDTAYRGQLSTMDSQQCTLHFGAKTLLTMDKVLSQLWTVDTISWHQGALSLLTMDS